METTEIEDMEMTEEDIVAPSIPQSVGNTSRSNRSTNPSTSCAPKKQKRTTSCAQDPSHGKSGRETSQIWHHFTKSIIKKGVNKGEERAKCKYCAKDLSCRTVNGTSNLWTHLNKTCSKSPFKFIDRKQPGLNLKPINGGEQGALERVVYNVTEVRRAIAEFVIIDEQPFRVVEGEGFKKLMSVILPNYVLPSRITIARQCLQIYHQEKEKLKKLIKDQRICLTSDAWTSLQNLTYMVITTHWIDDQWNLQKKILNFFQTLDHKGETVAKGIEACLLDWGIENIFTVTLDNASSNDASIKHLKARINDWKGVILENDFLHVRCNAHILNLIVKEGLSTQSDSISRVRLAVKYVKSSPGRSDSFKSYVEKVKLDTNGLLSLDVETRWNSTYLMLDTALKFEKAFSKMYDDDHKYFRYCLDLKGTTKHPSSEDWKNVQVFIKFLEIFYSITLKFSATKHVTANYFLHEIFNLQSFIVKHTNCEIELLAEMAKKMKVKFDKYWSDFEEMNMLLFVAVVLDPRYKMKYVEFLFNSTYKSLEGNARSTKVMNTLTRLYSHYKNSLSGTSNENSENQTSMMSQSDTSEAWQSQWEKHLEDEVNVDNKSDLDKYLMDPVEKNKDLNILAWWKASSETYPIVSKIARDVLAIPISTVASESAFSTGGRILDSYRTSLSTKTAEALVCSQQWLRSTSNEYKLEDLLEEIQKLEIVEKEYPGTALSID